MFIIAQLTDWNLGIYKLNVNTLIVELLKGPIVHLVNKVWNLEQCLSKVFIYE